MGRGFCLAIFVAACVLITGCASTRSATQQPGDEGENASGASTAPVRKLIVEDLVVGEGDEALVGRLVEVHYTGWLQDGTKFDSSYDRGSPFEFQLGAGQVIEGWERGILGMRAGGKRRLTIPPKQGYGSKGAGDIIPPDAVLIFEVELLGVY